MDTKADGGSYRLLGHSREAFLQQHRRRQGRAHGSGRLLTEPKFAPPPILVAHDVFLGGPPRRAIRRAGNSRLGERAPEYRRADI